MINKVAQVSSQASAGTLIGVGFVTWALNSWPYSDAQQLVMMAGGGAFFTWLGAIIRRLMDHWLGEGERAQELVRRAVEDTPKAKPAP